MRMLLDIVTASPRSNIGVVPAQLQRATICRPDGVGYDGAKSSSFKSIECRGGSASRRRDTIPQFRGMDFRLLRIDGTAFDGGKDKLLGHAAREAEVDGGVRHGLHDEENVLQGIRWTRQG